MRIVAWNIRAGGGRRVEAIVGQLERWRPDVVALSEFRATPPSRALAAGLAARGLTGQVTTAAPAEPGTNAVFVAARWPVRRVRLRPAPADRRRWLLAAVDAPLPLAVGALHAPNRVSGRKYHFLDAVLACARRWRGGAALLVGDTNSGRRGLDEAVPVFNGREEGWVDALAACGWTDAFRHLYPDARAYTWYSPNAGNGFRLDQAFVNRALLARVKDAGYTWGETRVGARRDALSDHAALIVDLAGP
jgi:exodeoxyribonuclease III